jgi:ferric-dicitrate binding protein FerR (iron transport regulator)
MTRDEIALLLDAYRDGEITPTEAARLAAVIREGGKTAAWISAEIESSGLIAQALDGTDSDAFVRGFFERLRAEDTGDVFVRDFEQKCAGASAPPRVNSILPFPSHSRRWWFAAAAALLIAAGVTLWPARPLRPPMAYLEQVQGHVVVVAGGREARVRSGHKLASGSGLRVAGEESSVTVVFADGTRLEAGADTIIAELSDAPAAGQTGGKRVVLSEGFLTAQVAAQPAGQPMILATPHSEVVVLGTAFTLSSGTAVTFLETQSGKVRLNRKSDGRSVEVPAGFDAVVADSAGPLVPQPFTPRFTAARFRINGSWAAALSPDGRTLAATRYFKGDVELWDVPTGRLRSAFRAHAKRAFTIAIARDGSIATGSLDGTAKLWDPTGNRLLATLVPGFGNVIDLAFSADGQVLTILSHDEKSGRMTLTGWDPVTRKQRWIVDEFQADHRIFSPDGAMLAAANRQNRSVTLWDLATGKKTQVLDGNANEFTEILRNVFSLAFSHDRQTLAIDSSSGLVTIWDVATGRIRTAFQRHGGRTYGMAFSPDDRLLATGHQDGIVRLWQVDTARTLAAFVGRSPAHVRAVSFTPDGRSLLAREIRLATHDARRDGAIQIWDVPTGDGGGVPPPQENKP